MHSKLLAARKAGSVGVTVAIARGKNRGGGWGALGVVFWIGGEVGGFVLGARHALDQMTAYGYGIGGAVCGALLAFVIVQALPAIPDDNGLPPARVV